MIDPQENDKVAALLGGLKRVDVPRNFESRVRARIAEGERPQASWLPAFLKIAVPAAGLATIAIVLYFAGIFSRGVDEMKAEDVPAPVQKQNEQRAEVNSTLPTSNVVLPGQQNLPSNEALAQMNTNIDRSPVRKDQQAPKKIGGVRHLPRTGGSMDFGFNPAQPDKLPPEFQAKPRPVDPKMALTRSGVPATEFLRYAGIQTDARGGELYVTSVVQNSPAERWGVRTGDKIEALNNNKINSGSSYPSGVDLHEIRVRRNGSVVNLKF